MLYLANGDEHSNTQILPKGLDEKYKYLDESYQEAYAYAKNEMNASEKRAAMLTEAVQSIDGAEGRLAAGQLQTEIGAITAAEMQARNRLIAQRNALVVLNNRAKNYEIIRAETNIRTKLEVQYYDPYHPF